MEKVLYIQIKIPILKSISNTNSFEKVLKYSIQNTIISKLATRTNVCFQNYFYYVNQIITILTTHYSVLSVFSFKLQLV